MLVDGASRFTFSLEQRFIIGVITGRELRSMAEKLKKNGTLAPFVPFEIFGNPKTLNCDRDSAGDAYFADGGLTVVRSGFLHDVKNNLLPFRWMGNRIHMIEQEPGGSDIDDYWQVAAMEAWLTKHGFTENTTPYK